MPGQPPIAIEIIRAMAVPSASVPPVAQPEVPPAPQPAVSLNHRATSVADPDEGLGDFFLMGGTNFRGFDFNESTQSTLPHPCRNPHGPRHYDAAPSFVGLPLLMSLPTHGAGPSHAAGYSYQSGPSYPTYHLPSFLIHTPLFETGRLDLETFL